MARREVVDCDRCGKRDIPEKFQIELSIRTGTSRCPAGGPSEPDFQLIQVCPACAGKMLQGFVASLDAENGVKYLAGIEATKKKRSFAVA